MILVAIIFTQILEHFEQNFIKGVKAILPSYPCFSRYNFRKKTLSSQPRFIFFILPSWEIKPEHAAVRVSSPTSLDTTSLAKNDGELGNSAGGEDELTWSMVGEFSPMKTRGAADLAMK